MDIRYKQKYKKYKQKYLNLINQLSGSKQPNKDAIFMLCILKDHYVLGACIISYLHRLFINKLHKTIDLVIMCDKYIYDKYNKLLSQYFDRVILLKMRYFEPSSQYDYIKNKYSSWIGYSLNKWQLLQHEEYNKILFLDIDIMPNRESFYDIFTFGTPGLHNIIANRVLKKTKTNRCVNNTPYDYSKPSSFDQYLDDLSDYGSMDGGICLLTPSKKQYEQYVKFTDELFKDGIYSVKHSGPDETSMFYFYLTGTEPMYNICNEYAVIPWDQPTLVEGANGYNFLSFVKPWNKPRILCWDEELIWWYLYDKMDKPTQLDQLYETTMADSIKQYNESKEYEKHKYYNKRVNNAMIDTFGTLQVNDILKLFELFKLFTQ